MQRTLIHQAAKMARRSRTLPRPVITTTTFHHAPLASSSFQFDLLSQQQQQQHRSISQHTQSKRQTKRKKKQQNDPFVVLGLKQGPNVDYDDVKAAFLKIAMAHHPDTSTAETDEDRAAHREVFVAARKAFEKIVPGPEGKAILKEDEQAGWEEAELNEWFQQESGHDMPFMDVKTRQEVSRVMDEIGGGLDRDGGMWTLARMVANDVKTGGDGTSILRLEAGNVRSRDIDGILRRKRKR